MTTLLSCPEIHNGSTVMQAHVHLAAWREVTADDAALLGQVNPRADVVAVAQSGHMIPWDNLRRHSLRTISAGLT